MNARHDFGSDPMIRWPRYERDWRRTRVSYVLALWLVVCAAILFQASARAATSASFAYLPSRAFVAADGYRFCPCAAGASGSWAGAWTITGCAQDTIARGGFEAQP